MNLVLMTPEEAFWINRSVVLDNPCKTLYPGHVKHGYVAEHLPPAPEDYLNANKVVIKLLQEELDSFVYEDCAFFELHGRN